MTLLQEKATLSLERVESASLSQTGSHVQEVIRSAQRELETLFQQRTVLMKRIGTLKQTLVGLAKVFGDDVLPQELLALLGRDNSRKQPGFTRACRTILVDATTPLDARQVCRELRRRFPELYQRHKDPLASVTTVLTRLVSYAEASCSTQDGGRRVWHWVADPISYPVGRFRPMPDSTRVSVENRFENRGDTFHSQ